MAVARPEVGSAILEALADLCRPLLALSAQDLPRLCARLEPRLLILELGPAPLADAAALKALRCDLRLRRLPILAISRGGESLMLAALAAGADDFMPQPLRAVELAGRVAALLRRGRRTFWPSRRFKRGALAVDLAARRALAFGRALDLTQTEFLILAELMRRAGAVAGRESLKACLWSAREVSGHTLESHVSNLRRKLGRLAARVKTVPGAGWRLA